MEGSRLTLAGQPTQLSTGCRCLSLSLAWTAALAVSSSLSLALRLPLTVARPLVAARNGGLRWWRRGDYPGHTRTGYGTGLFFNQRQVTHVQQVPL